MGDVSIVNDLLGAIVAYTTPGVSLDLLSYFMPNTAYSDAVWRAKAIVESRGLMVDDSVIQQIVSPEGGGKWYAYYLVQNRSYCGDLLEFRRDRACKVINQGIIHANILSHIEYRTKWLNCGLDHKTTIIQYDDLEINIAGKFYTNINSKIRASYALKELYAILLLDEYGDAWIYRRNLTQLKKLNYLSGVGVMCATDVEDWRRLDEMELVLDRCGTLRGLADGNPIDTTQKIVSNTGRCATAHNGTTSSIETLQFNAENPPNLNGNISVLLNSPDQPIQTNEGIVRHDFPSSIIKTNRTMYVNAIAMEQTTNRTQYVASPPGNLKWAIIDPPIVRG